MFTKAIAVSLLLCAMAVVVRCIEQPLEGGDALDHLKSIIQRQDNTIQKHESKIQQQEVEIQRQQDENQQQNDKIEQQQDKIQQQNEKNEQLQDTIHQQNDKIRHQEEINGMLIQMMKANTESIALLEKRLDKEASDSERKFLQRGDKHEKKLSRRSDDTDPLGIVVSHVSQRLDDVTAEIQSMKAKDELLSNGITEAKGSVYIRWGSSSCAHTSELVYSGFIGGSYYSHSGGATNPLCLPPNPVYAGNAHSNMKFGYAALYGGEYSVYPETSDDLDGVCAVCRAARASTVMIPATNVCTPGWDLQYSGSIMANRADDGRTGTEFICVDSKLEGRAGSKANDDQFVLYYAQSHCGSLPCPPYEEGKVVTCVVCSK